MKSKINVLIWIFIVCVILAPCLYAQAEQEDIEELKKQAPKIFIDCDFCDIDHIRREITFVNYVRVRQDSDIHILITNQRNGAGGNEYTMEFIGRRQFEGMNNTVTYNTMPTDTSDIARRKQVENLKKGLFPFLMQTPLAEYLSVAFRQRLDPTSVDDPWNFWVFTVGANAWGSGEERRNDTNLAGNFSANRTTPDWKILNGLNLRRSSRFFEYSDGSSTTDITEDYGWTSQVVKSLGPYWSADSMSTGCRTKQWFSS